VLLAVWFGVCIGFVLCSIMIVASDEERRAERSIPGVPPQPDSQ
jgi:hypothetical protein